MIAFAMKSEGQGLAQSATSGPTSSAARRRIDAWLRLSADGRVTVLTGKSEFGQGIRTALIQIVAEELDVPLEAVTVACPDTDLSPSEGDTSRSFSIIESGSAVRQAAAQARSFLLSLASRELRVDEGQLTVRDGVISDGSRHLSYADLVINKRIDQEVTGHAPTKDPLRSRFVGKSVPRVDIPAKVTGGVAYVQDLRLDGLVHARVIRPPIDRPDIVLEGLDVAGAIRLPGVIRVVQNGHFVGVIAHREEHAIVAAEALRQSIRWNLPELPALTQLEEYLRSASCVSSVIRDDGAVSEALATAKHVINASYFVPFQSHGSIGPSCAVAHVEGETLTVWCSTQSIFGLRKDVASFFRMSEEHVRVIHMEGAGCYGQNGADDAAMDACLLAREVPGRPVRVQWRRQDEFAWEAKAPPMSMDITAGSTDGKIVAFDYEYWTGPNVSRYGSNGSSTALPAWHVREPAKPFFLQGAGSNLSRVLANAPGFYSFPGKRIRQHVSTQFVPLRCGEMRGVSAFGHYFAIQATIDELAAQEAIDPIQFTLDFTDDKRMRRVIEAVAEASHWVRGPAPSGHGQGFSSFFYDRPNSRGACVVNVSVDQSTGQVKVTRVTAAFDVGRIINPDGVRNQMEGGIIQAISRTLCEEVRFEGQAVSTLDWGAYPILTFADIPDIEVILIDQPEEPSGGAGETQAPIIPGAIACGIFDALGVRLRRIPFLPERVKEALAARATVSA
jgi:CO/xanthine dehydrogenase Mo-binding subunit